MTINYPDIHRDIIEKCKKGNKKAQFELYTLYSKAMFNICMRMINNREEAEDLLQESFSEAFRNLNEFRFESAFGAWLKRIVINRSINALKRKKAELVLHDNMAKFDKIDEHEETNFETDIRRIHKAMEKLPDGYRVIFSLYLLEGYDHTEISEIMGITESTSKSQFLRAKRRLKEILTNQN